MIQSVPKAQWLKHFKGGLKIWVQYFSIAKTFNHPAAILLALFAFTLLCSLGLSTLTHQAVAISRWPRSRTHPSPYEARLWLYRMVRTTGIFPGWTGYFPREKSGEFEGKILLAHSPLSAQYPNRGRCPEWRLHEAQPRACAPQLPVRKHHRAAIEKGSSATRPTVPGRVVSGICPRRSTTCAFASCGLRRFAL